MVGSDPTLVNSADASGFTPLMLACRNGSTSIVELLLKAGADPLKSTYSSGNNSLFWACYTGHLPVAKQLIEHIKANTSRGGLLQFIGLKNRNGDTALMFAANAGAHQIAHLLQNEGADLSLTNNSKMTALHCAAANQHFETVAGLINTHLNVKNTLERRQQLQKTINARDQQGRTALLMAATHGATSVIELLLEYGADMTSKNNANESALDVAKKSLESAKDNETKTRLTKCVELLEEKWRKLESQSQALADLLLEDEKYADKKGNSANKNGDNNKKNQKKKINANTSTTNKKTDEQAKQKSTQETTLEPKNDTKKTVNVEPSTQPEQRFKTPANKSNSNTKQSNQPTTSNITNTNLVETVKEPFSYASVVSKNLPPRAVVVDTPPVTPSKLNPSGATPKRTQRQRQYDANNDEDIEELLRKAKSYDLLQQTLEAMHVQTAQLGLECEHMFGLNLSSLSMSQLSALEELHFDALKQLSEAKVDYVRDLEQIRQEERLALERTIMRLTKQLNENNE